ncbi:MAG: ATP-binding protein [Gaiellaceae bacterium]
MGLAIAHAFAHALGGDLRYEQAQPRGARFVLSLPSA